MQKYVEVLNQVSILCLNKNIKLSRKSTCTYTDHAVPEKTFLKPFGSDVAKNEAAAPSGPTRLLVTEMSLRAFQPSPTYRQKSTVASPWPGALWEFLVCSAASPI